MLKPSGAYMKHSTSWGVTILFTGLLVLVFSPRAYAYLDPGSGSFFFQMMIAALVAASFTLKIFWKNVSMFFSNILSRWKRKPKKPEHD